MAEPTLLIVDESAIYGGHELMFMSILRGVLPQLACIYSIKFLVNSRNEKLLRQLAEADFLGIEVVPISISKFPIKPISGLFMPTDFWRIKRVIRKLSPSLVLNIQGTIEIGCTTLRVCKSLKTPVFSYLPITKSSAQLGVFLGRLRDWVCRRCYYSIPNKIITISDGNADELNRLFGVSRNRLAVVYNFVESKSAAFKGEMPEFADGKVHLALVGRISNAQKRQYDFMQAWLASQICHNYVVHVVGDDDSLEAIRLRELCCEAVSDGLVVFHGWRSSDYVSAVIQRCRLLLIPSRFEGVPLVMIEAIKLKRLVVATNVDGMKEFLPRDLLFEMDDWEGMKSIIRKIECQGEYGRLAKQSEKNFGCFNASKSQFEFFKLLNEEINNRVHGPELSNRYL
jgi:glycosyltransferase involved in cell wall biosynthesis